MEIRLYSASGCPFARRTRMVLREKGAEFEANEVDLKDKSEEFLEVSPTGKVPVVVVDGDSLYESNVVNEFLDEVFEAPALMPKDAKERAFARIWMSRADSGFYPNVFVASVGGEMGFSEERVADALEKLEEALAALEQRLEGGEYLAGGFSLADVAHAGQFGRMRQLDEEGGVSLKDFPNVGAWMERIEARESYAASA